jgi:hypothetical protein
MLGDLDEDGQPTILDIVRVLNHLNGTVTLSDQLQPFADVNQDGFITEIDADLISQAVLGITTLPPVPLARVLSSSPFDGEGGVSVTRKTILRFNFPLADTTVIPLDHFYAEFGGRRLLSRIELSGDRQRATLFYLEQMPGGARVRVSFNGEGMKDFLGRAIDPDGNGQFGGVATIDFDTADTAPQPATAISGRIFAAELMPGVGNPAVSMNRPLEHVTITVDGMEETLRTTTDAQGVFTLSPCPAGRFFVHIDGHTAVGSQWPNGDYYPVLGKAWTAVAGRSDNMAAGTGTIYLPLVKSGTLQDVSPIKDTMVTFPSVVVSNNPALAGVLVMVPANSLYSDDGKRGGRVGIAPVPSDRLPEPLPAGLAHLIDISVQTDGPMNFDQPVPVRFPNLPDPKTGLKLPPGAKSALWSFNHDTGKWGISGPMTVTSDGNFLLSDAGVGIRQPGWHGSMPGTDAKLVPPPKKNPCQGVTTGQIVDTIYDTGLAAVKCAAEFAGIGEALKAGLDLVSEIKKLSETIDKIQEEAHAGNTVAYAKASMEGVGSLKKSIVSAVKIFTSTQGPFSKITAISKCAESIAEVFDGLCGRFVKAGDGPCSSSVWLQIACTFVSEARTALAAINRALDALEEGITGKALSVTCSAIDFVATQLGLPAVQGDGGPKIASVKRPRVLNDNDPIPADIIASIDDMAVSARALKTAVTPFIAAADQIKDLQVKMAAVQQAIINFYFEQIGAPPNAYYLMEIQGQEIRGRSSAQGQIDLILAADSDFVLSIFDQNHGLLGVVQGRTSPNGVPTEIALPAFDFPADTTDADNDGLPDVFERIVGTDPHNPDTDGDGILDGAAIAQGLDPLGGKPLSTGIVATAPTPGTAVDVCAQNDVVVVAELNAGISIFNVFSGLAPTLIAQIDTPGSARSVSCSGNLIAVATDAAGLAIIDMTDPPASKIIHQVGLGSSAQAVSTVGNLAFVGLASGQVVSVDLVGGNVIDRMILGSGAVQDLVVSGDTLYVLTDSKLHALSFQGGEFDNQGFAAAPGGGTAGVRGRLFAGGGIAYGTYFQGYNIFDLTGSSPRFVSTVTTAQSGWRQLIANGSGIGLAAVGPTPQPVPGVDLSIYNLGDDGLGRQFVTSFPTPGVAYALTINNGIAYLADGDSGLQVVNYLPFDTKRVPPAISLSASFPLNPPIAEEGKLLRVSAKVSDDVQVRNVEFWVDGAKVGSIGRFPFEFDFISPVLTTDKTSFTLRAKAIDTGGNFAWSDPITVQLTHDQTPPRVLGRSFPSAHSIVGSVSAITVYFSEPIDVATVNGSTVQLVDAGPDRVFGTADDVNHAGRILYRDDLNAVTVTFAADLIPGHYQIVVQAPLADRTGLQIASTFRSDFWVISGLDSDHDGIPDAIEKLMGLDPFNSDSNGNGIPDGLEDYDHDGLPNAAEILLGSDPMNAHSIKPNVLDGDVDSDGDGLSNAREIVAGTDTLVPDTDGDGWNDEAEVTAGSDPLDPNSKPSMLISANPPVRIGLPQFSAQPNEGGLTVAQPSLRIGLPAYVIDITGGLTIARPSVQIVLPLFTEDNTGGLTVGGPPLKLALPAFGGDSLGGLTVALPPLKTKFSPQ